MLRRPPVRLLVAVVADVVCLARRSGAGAALSAMAGGVTGSVSAPSAMQVLVKDLDAIAPVALAPQLRVEDATAGALGDLEELNRARCARRADARLAASLANGWHAFVARRDGRAVGWYCWLDAGAAPHPHLRRLGIELGEGDVYGFDFFLAEAHRGEGRAVEFLHHVETRLRERGYERLWGYVDAANTPARWLYGMRGYAVVRTVHLRRASMRGWRAGTGGRDSAPRAPTSRRRRRRG